MTDMKQLFDLDAFMRDWRAARSDDGSKIVQAEYDLVMAAIAGSYTPQHNAREPAWLVEARKDMGLREIPGVKHAPRIMKMIALLGYPFSDDETPWCGTALSAWVKQAGLTPPRAGYRAASWASWGVACKPQVGAIGVKSRAGGNHVFLIVGETADRTRFKALGANQSNMVCIMDISKADTFAIRWPGSVPQSLISLPVMPAGTISSNEA